MRLNQEQIEAYRRDGVLPVGRVLNDEQLQAARGRIDQMLKEDLLDRPETEGGRYILRRLNVSRGDPWFGSLVRSPAVLDIAESVLGPNVQYFQDNIFFKPANVGGLTPFHQDNIWWKSDPPNMLTIWIALDDVDAGNGAVEYVRGSHSHLMDHTVPVVDPKGFTYNMLDQSKIKPAMTDRIVSFVIPSGHAIMHHCLTVHGSPSNASPRQRRAYTISLMEAGILSQDTGQFPLLRGQMPKQPQPALA